MDIKKLTDKGILLFDGAMGTMLQKRGLPTGGLPELYNLSHPQVVTEIHREYVRAGARVVTTNTFQANPLKIPEESGVEAVIDAGVRLAAASGAPFVALDVGPLGQLMAPMGTVSFEQAYEIFRRQAVQGEKSGADCIIMETFSDLLEIKTAVLAAKENTGLPVLCTMTYQGDLRTFLGTDPVTATLTLQSLGVDAVGVNCSLGPDELMPVVERILAYAKIPVIVQPNAGLPQLVDGETVYAVTPEHFCGSVEKMVEKGVRIVGGCCGTTPEFTRLLGEMIKGRLPARTHPAAVTAACSGMRTVIFDGNVTVIGERINPTGKKRLQQALRGGQMDYIVGEAIDQAEAGSDLLDINVGLPDIDEPKMIRDVIREVQSVVPLPLQLDSSDVRAIEAGARCYNGRPVINSANGKRESMDAVFPIVKKYGALVVCLALDENGIPPTAEGRYAIAEKLLENALRHGIPKEDILIDCLVLTASAQQAQVKETLRAIRMVKSRLGLKTVLGVSNVSFGLPARQILNATFLAAAFGAGLDAPILNPLSAAYMQAVDAYRVLANFDRDAGVFVKKYASAAPAAAVSVKKTAPAAPEAAGNSLSQMIVQGRKDETAPRVKSLLEEGKKPLELIDGEFIPALNAVGKKFEKKELFLPQLMQAAEAVKNGFAVIREFMEKSGGAEQTKGDILLATVQGDIHDIGKNIVKMLLENYGYRVIDLGRDVPIQTVVDTIREKHIRLAGLSALMTTTVKSMKDTISAVRAAGLSCVFLVGGAVLNEDYREFVGADYYAKDAMESVEIANRFFGHTK